MVKLNLQYKQIILLMCKILLFDVKLKIHPSNDKNVK